MLYIELYPANGPDPNDVIREYYGIKIAVIILYLHTEYVFDDCNEICWIKAGEGAEVYTEPDFEAEPCGLLPAGEKVTLTGRCAFWGRIDWNGTTAYVRYINLTSTEPR